MPAPLYVPAPFPILNGGVESMLTQLLHTVVPQPVVFEQGTICESAAWHIATATRRLHEVSEEQSEFKLYKFSRPSRSCTMKKMEERHKLLEDQDISEWIRLLGLLGLLG